MGNARYGLWDSNDPRYPLVLNTSENAVHTVNDDSNRSETIILFTDKFLDTAYLFVCFRKKSLVVEYFASLSLFILLFQRQNIMIVLLGTLWIVINKGILRSYAISII